MNLTDKQAQKFIHLLEEFIDAKIAIKIAMTQDCGQSGIWYITTEQEKKELYNFLTGKI